MPTSVVEPMIEGMPLVALIAPGPTTAELAPEFVWEPVDGVATYRLFVTSPSAPIWAWEGDATSVRLGAFTSERPAGFPGPTLTADSTWSVAALTADGTVIAISEQRPVAFTP